MSIINGNKKNMKKITLLLLLLTVSLGFSQNTETVDLNADWVGYMNVFDNPDDVTPDCAATGGYCFGSGWGLGDLVATVGTSNVTLTPNVNAFDDNADDAYWRDNEGAGIDGNKLMEANFFVAPGATYNGVALTFTGEITGFTLASPRYSVVAFIKTVGGTGIFNTVNITSTGVFTVSATSDDLLTGEVQYGFAITGLNANPADDWGSVVVAPLPLGIDDFQVSELEVFPNPTADLWSLNGPRTMNTIQVFDVLGKQVISLSPNSKNVNLDASTLRSGLYFARINTEAGTQSLRLVKQ